MPTRTFVTLACYALAITGWSSIDVTTVRAQPLGRTVVVPYFVGDAENSAIELARETDAALRARRAEVISLHDARDRFNARSREPRSASASDVDALAKEANMAMEHVAFGRTAAAQRSVQQIVELAERSLETLNRETARARTLLDACLSLVRASLHDNKRDEAIEQAMNCRRLVPDLAPSTTAHPATVIGALAEADDQLRRMHVGSLAVQVEPQRPCDVYLNGRLLGHTPFALEKAPAGDYRVQVECGTRSPARVHIVRLGDEPAQLVVDSAFDERVRTEPRLALRYPSTQDAGAALVADAVTTGREVRADDVLLVGLLNAQPTLLRVQVRHERLVAGASLAQNAPSADVAHAVDLLDRGRFVGVDPEPLRSSKPTSGISDITAPEPSAAPSPELRAPRTRAAKSMWMPWTGAAALVLGVAGEATGWFLYRARTREGEQLRESPSIEADSSQNWEDLRAPMFGVAAAGAGVAATGVALLASAKPYEKVPWWLASGAAGAGIGLAMWAGVDIARSDTCGGADLRACVDEEQRRDRGALLLMAAVPFLTLATTKIVRGRSLSKGDTKHISVAVAPQVLRVVGAW